MSVATRSQVIDLVDHYELLLLFRKYVDQCIEEYNYSNKVRPLSFDEWYGREYLQNLNELTTIIEFEHQWERAENGYLCGSTSEVCKCRIPADIVTESGGIVDAASLKRFACKLARNLNQRLPCVLYQGKRAYHWTWE